MAVRHQHCLHPEDEGCGFCRGMACVESHSSVPTFERTADAALAQVRSTYATRGGEYADSWSLDNLTTAFLDSTLAAIGLTDVPREVKRLLAMAALVDVKDSRLGGPWKADSVLDGIAYRAAYLTLREEYEGRKRST